MGRYSESFLLQTSLRMCPFKIKIPVSSLFLLSLLNISWMFTNSWTVNWVSQSQRHIPTPARYTIWLEKKISLHWQMFLSPILLFPFFGTMQLLSLWILITTYFYFFFSWLRKKWEIYLRSQGITSDWALESSLCYFSI